MRIVQLKELDETRGPRDGRRRAGARAWPRPRPRTCSPPPSARATSSGSPPQQETNELRTGAKREAEQARAAADREVQEARRTLAVEKERLAREAAEHHATATAETKRLVEEAEQRANAAEAAGPRGHRAGDQPPPAGADGGRAAAQPRPPRGRADRGLRATQADAITAAGKAEAGARAGRAQGRGRPDAKRRDAIVAQLGSLRDVIAGFGDDEPSTTRCTRRAHSAGGTCPRLSRARPPSRR